MGTLYANNASSTLAASITNVATSLSVQPGAGVKFPAANGAGNYFMATLVKISAGAEAAREIIRVNNKSTDVFTILRAQEGTSALPFNAGDKISVRWTAGQAKDHEDRIVAAQAAADAAQADTDSLLSSFTTFISNLASSIGSSLLGFIQAGAGAVLTTLQARGRLVVYATDHMTDLERTDVLSGTGALDVTNALISVIAYCDAQRVNSAFGGSPSSGSTYTLIWPKGRYKVTADLANAQKLNYLVWEGDRAIIETAAGITTLSGIRYMFTCKGITFRGGARALDVNTENADSSLIVLRDVEMLNQTVECIRMSATSQSTILSADSSCKFLPASGAKILTALSCDFAIFDGCWGTVYGVTTAFDVTDCRLHLNNFVGIPGPGLLSWVDMRGYSDVYITGNSRLGGEVSPDFCVRVYGSADTSYAVVPHNLVLENSQISADRLIGFYAIPNRVSIKNCWNPDFQPFYFDPSISSDDLAVIGSINWDCDVGNGIQPMAMYADTSVSPPTIAYKAVSLGDHYHINSGIPKTSDLVQQWAGDSASYTPNQTATDVTPTTVSGPFSVSAKQYTATAHNAVAALLYTTALSGIAAGIYTAVFNIEVISDDVIWPSFKASNTQRRDWTLPRGKHIVCIPFYYDGGASQTVGVIVLNIPSGAVFQIQRHRLYAGTWNITNEQAIVADIGFPSSGRWFEGDQTVGYNPNSTGYIGNVCRVAGVSGTWKSYGQITT